MLEFPSPRLTRTGGYLPVHEDVIDRGELNSYFSCVRGTRNWKTWGRVLLLLCAAVGVWLLCRKVDPWNGRQTSPDPLRPGEKDCSSYAYVQYATNEEYLCNSVMLFASLREYRVRPDLLLMYPNTYEVTSNTSYGRLLKVAQSLDMKLQPVSVQHFEGGESTWADSFTKLLAFNQTQYKRVLHLDSDATVLALTMIQPPDIEFERILDAFQHRDNSDFDMDIMNDLYGDSCIILPHRPYNLLSGMLHGREGDHAKYLGSGEVWDIDKVLDEAKYLHFSDWPIQKPWNSQPDEYMQQHAPKCNTTSTPQDCRDREKWLWLYSDFNARRSEVCSTR